MTKRFYAIAYTYGANMRDSDTGELIGQIVQFPNAPARDAWVDAGTVHYRNERGYREAITTRGETGQLIRKELAAAGRFGYSAIMDHAEYEDYRS
jgi:hypothetical protein